MIFLAPRHNEVPYIKAKIKLTVGEEVGSFFITHFAKSYYKSTVFGGVGLGSKSLMFVYVAGQAMLRMCRKEA